MARNRATQAQASLFDAPVAALTAGRLQQSEPAGWALQPGWRELVDGFFSSTTGAALRQRLQQRLDAGAVIYPPEPLRALQFTAFDQVQVVILGQDPYHGPGQAEGLAFSVAPGCRIPPSLRNIFKELQRDLGQARPESGSLLAWARRGVLLLNNCFTVEDGQAASHAGWGWEILSDALVRAVAARPQPCVYLLWGAHAQAKHGWIEQVAQAHGGQALILTANHPSPLSALRPPQPFIGCGHFSAASAWLARHGRGLDWALPGS